MGFSHNNGQFGNSCHENKYYEYGLGNLMEKSSTTSRSQITKELTFIKVLQKA
jgi:hypothetical protein